MNVHCKNVNHYTNKFDIPRYYTTTERRIQKGTSLYLDGGLGFTLHLGWPESQPHGPINY